MGGKAEKVNNVVMAGTMEFVCFVLFCFLMASVFLPDYHAQMTFKIKSSGDWIEDVRGASSVANSFWNCNGVREKVEQTVKEKK